MNGWGRREGGEKEEIIFGPAKVIYTPANVPSQSPPSFLLPSFPSPLPPVGTRLGHVLDSLVGDCWYIFGT